MDKCPFCGAVKRVGEKSWARFECNYLIQDGTKFIRPPSCYERQLAHQTTLLREALEVVEAWEEYSKYTNDEAIRIGQSNKIPGGSGSYRFTAFIRLRKARKALIPKIREAIK